MKEPMKGTRDLSKENRRLEARLAAAEELLAAIRNGSVDALVTDDLKIFTLTGADRGYRILVETINEGAATLTLDGTLTYCNRRLAAMLGLPVEAIIGSSLFDYFDPGGRQGLRSMLLQGQERTARAEFRLKRSGGKARPVLVSCSSLPLDDIGLCLIITDLTEQKSVELQLEVKNRQLRHFADRLFHAEEEERERLAGILHGDLQQILVACMMRLDIPRCSRENRGKIRKLLNDAVGASRALCTELRPPALFEGGLVAGARWLIERIVRHLGLTIHLRSDGYEEIADRRINTVLYQCVRESLFNLIKYTRSTKAVLTFATVEGKSQIKIENRGRWIIEPKAHGRKAKEADTLGFSAIDDRLRALGGRFHIESDPARGTVATLSLPPKGPRPSPIPDGRWVKSPPPKRAMIRVLVADDHGSVRAEIVHTLSADRNISVVGQAKNGSEAVSMIGKLEPDVVVLDLDMPVLNGIEATRRLRKNRVKVKILAVSVVSGEGVERTALEAGADAFLPKSAGRAEWIGAVRAIASSSSTSPPTTST
ncbi:MAG TPA: hypothetical protein DCM05_00315 [Elusimicrobia bacterium]|nr:hypothetical protein [Elusimicrobiota bacterium]